MRFVFNLHPSWWIAFLSTSDRKNCPNYCYLNPYALQDAAAADAVFWANNGQIPDGKLLFGVPIVIKDLMKREIIAKKDSGTILDALNVKNIPELQFYLAEHPILEFFVFWNVEFLRSLKPPWPLHNMSVRLATIIALSPQILLSGLTTWFISKPDSSELIDSYSKREEGSFHQIRLIIICLVARDGSVNYETRTY